jgi:DNA oxidative demethylase
MEDAPPGLIYVPGFITIAEHDDLLVFIETIDLEQPVIQGQAAKRAVKHFGVHYDMAARKTEPGPPVPEELIALRDRCADAASVDREHVVECLVTRYPPGSGIGWHSDAPMFGSKVMGVSLRSGCVMRFRRRKEKGRATFELALEPRSAYVIGGAARWQWQHHIRSTPDLRYSITFRTLRADLRSEG